MYLICMEKKHAISESGDKINLVFKMAEEHIISIANFLLLFFKKENLYDRAKQNSVGRYLLATVKGSGTRLNTLNIALCEPVGYMLTTIDRLCLPFYTCSTGKDPLS